MKKGPGPRHGRIGQAASIMRIGPTRSQARRDRREQLQAEEDFRRRRLDNPQREEADDLVARVLARTTTKGTR